MFPIWPASLPQSFNRQGHERGYGDGRLRTKTDTGPGKMRRRSTAVSDPLPGNLTMRLAQLLIWEAFLDEEIGGGTLPFLFPDPLGGLPILVAFGEEMPRSVPLGGDLWLVSLPLERIRTGAFLPGLPELADGLAWVTFNGAYVLANRVPVYAEDDT